MPQTNAEKQSIFRDRQRQLAADQAKIILEQQTQITALQSRVNELVALNHALEVKALKAQLAKKK